MWWRRLQTIATMTGLFLGGSIGNGLTASETFIRVNAEKIRNRIVGKVVEEEVIDTGHFISNLAAYSILARCWKSVPGFSRTRAEQRRKIAELMEVVTRAER